MLFVSATSSAAEMSLDEALARAEHYSTELSANRHERQALLNEADSATQLPDPKLEFGIENVPVGGPNAHRFTREDMTMQRIGVTQEYVSSTKREKKADTLIAQATATTAGLQTLRAQLQRDTAQAWLDLALAQRRRKLCWRKANVRYRSSGRRWRRAATPRRYWMADWWSLI
jgi:multidrug efflux pump subunit AcrA (membrane-fusion protein)